jgi:hypothetical protein
MLRHKWLLIGVLGTFALFPLVQAAEESGGAGGNGAAAPAGGQGGRERGNRRGGRGSGGGGNFDPSQMRERMMNAVKEQLGATDDEWKTLQPKIEKVSTLQRDLRPMMGGYGGRMRSDGDGGAESATAKAQSELRTALQDKSTSADDIAKKLTALREARAKAREDLAAAQKDLKASVNARQEAALVASGLLD